MEPVVKDLEQTVHEAPADEKYQESLVGKARSYSMVILQVIGFGVLILSAVVALVNASSPFVPLIACVGLAFHAFSTKLSHQHIKKQKEVLQEENVELAVEISAETHTPRQRVQQMIRRYWPKNNLGWLSGIALLCQILGLFGLMAASIVAFYPPISPYNGLLTQVGWAIFTVGSQLENYIHNREKESASHLNEELREKAEKAVKEAKRHATPKEAHA